MKAVYQIDKEVQGKTIVVVFPDTGERYLSLLPEVALTKGSLAKRPPSASVQPKGSPSGR
jgi:hypothetical protein